MAMCSSAFCVLFVEDKEVEESDRQREQNLHPNFPCGPYFFLVPEGRKREKYHRRGSIVRCGLCFL